MNDEKQADSGAVLSSDGLGVSFPERACEHGCNGCDECIDYESDEGDDE